MDATTTPNAAVADLPSTLQIGRLTVSPPVVLAPMAGVTTAPYRTLCRRFGNEMAFDDTAQPPGDATTAVGGLYVNQMITARALIEGHRKMLESAKYADGETPRSIQLYGTDPYWIGEAVKKLVSEGAVDHIDMNLGCRQDHPPRRRQRIALAPQPVARHRAGHGVERRGCSGHAEVPHLSLIHI